MITLTRQLQRALHVHSRGFLPPGSCLITSLPQDVAGAREKVSASSIAVVPTIALSVRVEWHQGSRLYAMLELAGRSHAMGSEPGWTRERLVRNEERASIDDGACDCCGNVSAERCAQQDDARCQNILHKATRIC